MGLLQHDEGRAVCSVEEAVVGMPKGKRRFVRF